MIPRTVEMYIYCGEHPNTCTKCGWILTMVRDPVTGEVKPSKCRCAPSLEKLPR